MNDNINKIETTITYMQMFAVPPGLTVKSPRPDVTIMRAFNPTVSFYRYLYDTVGAAWLWYERRIMAAEALAAIVQHPRVELYIMYVGGVPAGYAELDRRHDEEIELAYFGLLPEFIGQRLGKYLLHWAIARAWDYAPKRLWIHTSTLDHSNALPLYKKTGFVPYKTEIDIIDDPRQAGIM